MTLALREDYAIIISIDDYGAEIMEYCLRERGETVNNYVLGRKQMSHASLARKHRTTLFFVVLLNGLKDVIENWSGSEE